MLNLPSQLLWIPPLAVGLMLFLHPMCSASLRSRLPSRARWLSSRARWLPTSARRLPTSRCATWQLRAKRWYLVANVLLHVLVMGCCTSWLKTLSKAPCTAFLCLEVVSGPLACVRLEWPHLACVQATPRRTRPPATPRRTRPAATPRPTVSWPWLLLRHCDMALLNPMRHVLCLLLVVRMLLLSACTTYVLRSTSVRR